MNLRLCARHRCLAITSYFHSRCKDLYLERHPSATKTSRLTVLLKPSGDCPIHKHSHLSIVHLVKEQAVLSCCPSNKRCALYRARKGGQGEIPKNLHNMHFGKFALANLSNYRAATGNFKRLVSDFFTVQLDTALLNHAHGFGCAGDQACLL